tara:strand:+ start:28 stop:432 length:405 start_codon:yes stop_codon:yes gene_type:complete
MQFKLQRVWVGDQGCFSVLSRDEFPPFAVCLERTFGDGSGGHTEVVIPPGSHKCVRSIFNRGGYPSYEILLPETEHTLVKFHKGNTEDHSMGCILVGESFSMFKDMAGIGSSHAGFTEFMRNANGVTEFQLLVC